MPDAVRVVGSNDLPLAMQTVPRLSSVRRDIAGGAATMCDLLFRRIGGETPGSVRLPTVLFIRESS